MTKDKVIKQPSKFVTDAPPDKIKNLVKKQIKGFLMGFDPPLDQHDKAVDQIPEFIDWLAGSEPKFAKIEKEHIKTTYKLIACLRDELRNNMRSILTTKVVQPKEKPEAKPELKVEATEDPDPLKDEVQADDDDEAPVQEEKPDDAENEEQ